MKSDHWFEISTILTPDIWNRIQLRDLGDYATIPDFWSLEILNLDQTGSGTQINSRVSGLKRSQLDAPPDRAVWKDFKLLKNAKCELCHFFWNSRSWPTALVRTPRPDNCPNGEGQLKKLEQPSFNLHFTTWSGIPFQVYGSMCPFKITVHCGKFNKILKF